MTVRRIFRVSPPLNVGFTTVCLDMIMEMPRGKTLSRYPDPDWASDWNVYCHGTPSANSPVACRGVFDRALWFEPGRYLSLDAPGSLNIPGSLSLACWVATTVTTDTTLIMAQTAGPTSQFILNTFSGNLQFYSSGSGWANFAITMPPTKDHFTHLCATGDIITGIQRGFQDGLEISCTTGYDHPTVAVPTIAYLSYPTSTLSGKMDHPLIYAGVLTPQQVYDEWVAGASKPVFQGTLDGWPVSIGNKVAGQEIGPYRIYAGTATIIVDSSMKKWINSTSAQLWIERTAPGGAYGTWKFPLRLANDATAIPYFFWASHQSAQQIATGGTGSYLLWVNQNQAIGTGRYAETNLMSSADAYLDVETDYDFWLTRRIDGQTTVYVKGGDFPDYTLIDTSGGAGSNPYIDNTNKTAQYSVAVLATGDRVADITKLQGAVRPPNYPWEFGTGTWGGIVDGDGTVMHKCLTAGYCYLPNDLNIPTTGSSTEPRWNKLDMRVYKGADDNVLDVLITARHRGGFTATGQYGFGLRFSSDERVQFINTSNGVPTVEFETAAGYITHSTKYHILFVIAYRYLEPRQWYCFLKGGAYTNWVSLFDGESSTVENYFCVDCDPGDRVSASPLFDSFAAEFDMGPPIPPIED